MKPLKKIISIFIISVPILVSPQVLCVKPVPDNQSQSASHPRLKKDARAHSTGDIKYSSLTPQPTVYPLVRSHSHVRNELIKNMAKNISNVFCSVFKSKSH